MDILQDNSGQSGLLKIKFQKIMANSPNTTTKQSHAEASHTSAKRPPNNMCYSVNELKAIGCTGQHDHRLKILPFGMVSRVRSLKCTHKPQRNNKVRRSTIKQYAANQANLINVKKARSTNGNITIGICNIQSIQRKELQVIDLISDHSLDLLVVTET